MEIRCGAIGFVAIFVLTGLGTLIAGPDRSETASSLIFVFSFVTGIVLSTVLIDRAERRERERNR